MCLVYWCKKISKYNLLKGALSGMRDIFAKLKPFKNDEKCSFRSQNI